jgi:hypothetical protein
MPKKKSKAAGAAGAALPSIPKELIDQFVSGPMSADTVNAASLAFKKALIERALGAELSRDDSKKHRRPFQPTLTAPPRQSDHGQAQLSLRQAPTRVEEASAAGREAPEEAGAQHGGGRRPGGACGQRGIPAMSKGLDRKKETKRKPAKTLLEKRAAKAEKKKGKR